MNLDFPLRRWPWLCLAGLVQHFLLPAADLRIDAVDLRPADQLEIRFTPDAASYYRVLRGDALTAINQPVAVTLTGPVTVAAPSAQGFFRLEQLARSAAQDSDGDGRDDVAELQGGTNPLFRDDFPAGLTGFASSPADGEEGISVTRETVLRFSQPLAEGTVLGNTTFFAEGAGRRVLSRTELSPDRRTATLFFLEPLPGGAQVRVTFDGDKVRDAGGLAVDADGDGLSGGVGFVNFTTLNNHGVPRTAVIGRVFASELVPGTDTGTNALNRPLKGAIVTVDGQEESLRAVTDAQGNFKLTNAPAGRFFVHVDGRTADGSQWPAGDYYPVVGKAWETVAGREDNLANGNGEVYLPLIRAGSLQPVSANEPTAITFPNAVLLANPTLAGVEVRVPAGALFDDNGARGGRVGIAPVPPDRLPEPLPAGLNFPLVITIQTDGPRNFAVPVPVRFPNLPDSFTGVKLPPGAKTALWSFDHDKGYWEVVGPATVSADGNFVDTDPGVGVLQPGWHGVQPGVPISRGRLRIRCESDGVAQMSPITVVDLGDGNRQFTVQRGNHPGVVQWFSPEAQPQTGTGDSVIMKFCKPGIHGVRAVLEPECFVAATQAVAIEIKEDEVCGMKPLILSRSEIQAGVRVEFGPFQHTAGTIEWTAEGGSPASGIGESFSTIFCEKGSKKVTRKLRTECGRTCQDSLTVAVVDKTVAVPHQGCFLDDAAGFEYGILQVGSVLRFVAPKHVEGTVTWNVSNLSGQPDGSPSSGIGDTFDVVFSTPGEKRIVRSFRSECGNVCELAILRRITNAPVGPNAVPLPIAAVPRTPQSPVIRLVGAPVEPVPITARLSVDSVSRAGLPQRAAEPGPREVTSRGRHYFVIQNLVSGATFRGECGANGIAHPRPFILEANNRYRETIATADGRFVGSVEFTTGDNGTRLELPDFLLTAEAGDRDHDGLSDRAELVLGSNPDAADSDGDGINDGAEARTGSPVTRDQIEPLGLVNVANTPGYAWDVAVDGTLAVVADGAGGLSVFNVLNPLNPALVGRLALRGEAQAVAAGGGRALVALGVAGVAIVDLGTVPNLAPPTLRSLGAPVRSVALSGNLGFVGLDSGAIVTLDLNTGTEVGRAGVSGRVEDLLVGRGSLFALTLENRPQVFGFRIDGAVLNGFGGGGYEGSAGVGGRRLRLGLGGDRLYATHTAGFAVFDVSDSQRVDFLANHSDGQFGWRQLAADSVGNGLAAADPNSTADGEHDVQLHDLRPNGAGQRFVTQFATPGGAEAVALSGNFAFIADGEAGLTVVRYTAADRFGRPPTVRLRSPFAEGLAEEGAVGVFVAEATDDVGVARVEFFVDGMPVATDTVAPFELRLLLPRRSSTTTDIRLRARATDTGGNATESAELRLTLTADASAPTVQQVIPAFGAQLEGGLIALVGAVFNEPLDPASVTAGRLALVEAGPDAQLGTPDDVPVTRATPEYRPALNAVVLAFAPGLTGGKYRATLSAGLTDTGGRATSEPVIWDFSLARPRVISFRTTTAGRSGGLDVEVVFSSPMDAAAVRDGFIVTAPGPDGDLGNADDIVVPTTLEYSGDGAVARRTFSLPLAPGSYRYRARLSANVADLVGSTLGTPSTLDLTVTQTAPVDLSTGTVFRGEGNPVGPGSEDHYTFLLPANQLVTFGVRILDGFADWELFDPQGQPVFGPEPMWKRPQQVMSSTGGLYRLVIRGGGGDYRFIAGQPQNIVTRHDLRVEREFLDPEGVLHPPSSRRTYELELDPGQVIRVQFGIGSEACTGTIATRLFAPDGLLLAENIEAGRGNHLCHSSHDVTAVSGGLYRLVVELPANAQPDYFQIWVKRARLAAGQWLNLNQTRNPLTGEGTALLVRSDEVFVAGQFAEGVAVARQVTDGWSLLGVAKRADDVPVRINALVHSGTHLHAAGNFTEIGGVAASGVARWNGTAWEAFGEGIAVSKFPDSTVSHEVRDLAFVGTDLYAGGFFRASGGVGTFNLSRWDGTQWNAVPNDQITDGVGSYRGAGFSQERINSLAVAGDTLYGAGLWREPGNNVGAWQNGVFAHGLGGGLHQSRFDRGSASLVRAVGGLVYFQGGFEESLAGGGADDLRGLRNFVLWNGTQWQRPSTVLPFNGVEDFVIDGARIAVGGNFSELFAPDSDGNLQRDTITQGIGLWDGTQWLALGRGVEFDEVTGEGGETTHRIGRVNRLQLVGRRIYATGRFTYADRRPVPFFAVWESAP